MARKSIKKVKNQINDLLNDPDFIRLGELLAEKRRLQQIEKKMLTHIIEDKIKKYGSK